MGRIVISENVTLDGVVQDPTGEEGFRYGGWFVDVGKNDLEAFFKVALEEALRAEALLMGRRTFEIFAGRFTRAPLLLQKAGLEWAWRLAQDPARLWRRYLSTNGYVLAMMLREASRRLFRPAPRGSS